jgi:NAD(P)-dependent dehydrogenase (short-subunit alcohol dehydrogenase family)
MTGRDANATDRARRRLGDVSRNAIAIRIDVSDRATIESARTEVLSQFGRVDVLVNNAAILLFESEDVLSIPTEAFRETFDVNLFGVIEMCRTFVPLMAQRGYGRVVNVSSGAGQLSRMSTYAPAYSMAKVALNAFTRILAATYREQGVLANAVDPGWVRTRMGGASATRSVEQGADTIVWLATLRKDGPTGGFFRDRESIPW